MSFLTVAPCRAKKAASAVRKFNGQQTLVDNKSKNRTNHQAPYLSFFNATSFVSHRGIIISTIGAFTAILLISIVSASILSGTGLSVIIASMGASAVILFAVSSSPMARPWPLIGGHLVSAAIGVSCFKFIPDILIAAPLAVALAITAMLYLRCLHPPGGATALIAVIGGNSVHALGFQFTLTPVALNTAIMLAVSLLFGLLEKKLEKKMQAGYTYNTIHNTWWDVGPSNKMESHPPFDETDLSKALQELDTYIDVTHEDLNKIYSLALFHSHTRHLGDSICSDLMSRSNISVEFGTELNEVWELMKQHNLHGLPVVSAANHVIGIITTSDFVQQANQLNGDTEQQRLQHLITPSPGLTSNKPEVAGQIMTSPAITMQANDKLTQLIRELRYHDIDQIPIVDNNKKLLGMITSADLHSPNA